MWVVDLGGRSICNEFDFIVWELFQDKRSKWSWKEMTRMASTMCRKLIRVGIETMTWPEFEWRSVGVEDDLCFQVDIAIPN